MVSEVIDGDTFEVVSKGEEATVRLCGVDAPELDQTFGKAVQQELQRLLEQGDGLVDLEVAGEDEDGRL